MSKSEEFLRLERNLIEQPELKKKLDAEIIRIAEAGEAESDWEAMAKAAAALGYTITIEELERAAADLEKLDDNELEAAGGDTSTSTYDKKRGDTEGSCTSDYSCMCLWHKKWEDEKGHSHWCLTAWHCHAVTLQTETKSKDVACWSNYICPIFENPATPE